jgi:ABC-type dipeptide/oligopeptide/nickel transport system permease component
MMQLSKARVRKPSLILVPLRALFFTLVVTLLTFAVSLLLGIIATVILARWRGVMPDMRLAYRHVAAPVAIVVGTVVLVLSFVTEIRHYRQAKALAAIERAG